MKLLILSLLILSNVAKAQSQVTKYIYIDSAAIKARTEYNKSLHITGRVLSPEGKPDGQLLFYVRNCGKLKVPKNSEGKIPKAGQTITVSMKDSCRIFDWN